MIAVLTMGYDTMTPVMWSALIGFVVSFPLSYLIAKKLYESGA